MGKIIYDSHFEKIDFSELKGQSFEACTFVDCQFTEADFSAYEFLACEFRSCDLSMATLHKSAWKDVRFHQCKLLGLHFKDCNTFLLQLFFQDCILDLCSFFKLPLKKSSFLSCSIKEVDFAEADLSYGVFDDSNLHMSIFDQTNLQHADFRKAENYQIDPEMNRITKAKFSSSGLAGLLGSYDIHIS